MYTAGRCFVRILVKIGSRWSVPLPITPELVNESTNNRCEREMESFSAALDIERGEEKMWCECGIRPARFSGQYLFNAFFNLYETLNSGRIYSVEKHMRVMEYIIIK